MHPAAEAPLRPPAIPEPSCRASISSEDGSTCGRRTAAWAAPARKRLCHAAPAPRRRPRHHAACCPAAGSLRRQLVAGSGTAFAEQRDLRPFARRSRAASDASWNCCGEWVRGS